MFFLYNNMFLDLWFYTNFYDSISQFQLHFLIDYDELKKKTGIRNTKQEKVPSNVLHCDKSTI